MKELMNKVGEMEYDGLITGLTPPARIDGGTIRKLTTAATYKRGTILAKSSGTKGDGKLVILGTAAKDNETLTPDCILCDDTEIGTEDVDAVVYASGRFDPAKVIVAEGYTIKEADKDTLRTYDIVFKAAHPGK